MQPGRGEPPGRGNGGGCRPRPRGRAQVEPLVAPSWQKASSLTAHLSEMGRSIQHGNRWTVSRSFVGSCRESAAEMIRQDFQLVTPTSRVDGSAGEPCAPERDARGSRPDPDRCGGPSDRSSWNTGHTRSAGGSQSCGGARKTTICDARGVPTASGRGARTSCSRRSCRESSSADRNRAATASPNHALRPRRRCRAGARERRPRCGRAYA